MINTIQSYKPNNKIIYNEKDCIRFPFQNIKLDTKKDQIKYKIYEKGIWY